MLRLFNTLSGKKETFVPIEKGKVRIYSCGPTVYDYAHIGNLVAFLYADLLRRYLEFSGYEVRHIMNITDVGHLTADDIGQADTGEDKMMKGALREKKTPQEIALFYTEKFFADVKSLNLKEHQYYPRATAHITQMIGIIEKLIEKGLAYEKNGNVFFAVDRFSGYGKLSKKKLEELEVGARLEEHPDKKNPFDFALWLKAPKEHLMKWSSPWGEGYPGWHIECSAMSMEYLGETLDIHTGGEDHIFPHHENEIAQSEGLTGQSFANFWLHNRFLLVDGTKMSKSKGNFHVLADILAKGYLPMDFRLLILSSHYRSSLNFTWQALDQARTNREKIERFASKVGQLASSGPEGPPSADGWMEGYAERFKEAMDDDLNGPLAISTLYALITETNKKISAGQIGKKQAQELLKLWHRLNSVLGLSFAEEALPKDVAVLVEKREVARKEKNYPLSDKLRLDIEKLGYAVEDGSAGQSVKTK